MNKRHAYRKSTSMFVAAALTLIGTAVLLTPSYAATPAADEAAPSMKPRTTSPAEGAQIPETEGIDHVEIYYKSTSEMGLEALNREGREFTLTRDGATILTVPCTTESVKMSTSDSDAIIVTFPTQTTPGTYTLTVPEGLVKQSQPPKFNKTDPDTPDYQLTSARYVYSFTIKKAVEFQMSPMPGQYEADKLGTFKFVYPEGTTITVNNSLLIKPRLMRFVTNASEEGTTTMRKEAKTYSISAEGNTVTLTATSQSALPYLTQNVNLEYYYLTVPADSWTATYEGQDYPIYALNYSKYDVRKSAESTGLAITPAADDSKTFKPEEFQTLTLSYPSNWTPALNVGQTAGYLKQAGPQKPTEYKGFMFGTFKVTSIDTDNHTMMLTIAPANGYSNNLEQMQSGWYFFELNMRAFKMDGSTTANSPKIDFAPYLVAGGDNLTATITARSDTKWVTVANIDKTLGFNGVSLTFPMTVQLADPSAKIRLLNDGTEVASMTASECVASNTMQANNQTSGKDWYYPLGQTVTAPGRYTVEVPANTFHQTQWGDFYNATLQIPLNFREEEVEEPSKTFVYTITPDPATEIMQDNPGALEEIMVTFPEATTVAFTGTADSFASLADPNGNNVALSALADGNRVIFQTSDLPDMLVAGNYTFTIQPEKIAINNTDARAAAGFFQGCTATFTVKATEIVTPENLYTLNPDPANKLESALDLRVVKITFNEAQSITVAAMNLRNTASLTKPDGTIIYNRNAAATVSGNTLTITFDSAPTADGDYTLKIFANKVRLTLADGTQKNVPELIFNYSVGTNTAIDAIDAETSYRVMSIDGKVLIDNGTEADVKALAPGLYIVNGKKIIIN